PNGGEPRVLIVNGFDRLDRFQNFRYFYDFTGDNRVDRVWQRYNNSFDYAVQMATAIHANRPDLALSTTSNEAVISGAVNLNDYDAVMWILGDESTANETFSASEQGRVTSYLAQSGKLFVSGSEIGWDLDAQGLTSDRSFYNNALKASYVADDAGTYSASGAPGSIFAGLNVSFSNGSEFSNLAGQTYNVDFPDRINPTEGSTAAMNYPSGPGVAGIQYTGGDGSQVVLLAFPFEAITSAASRTAVMDRVLEYFQLIAPDADFDGDGAVDGRDFLSWQRHLGASGASPEQGDADGDGTVDGADLAHWREQFGAPAAMAASVIASSASESLWAANSAGEGGLISLAQHEEALRTPSASGEGDAEDAAILLTPASDELPLRATGERGPAEYGWTSAAASGMPRQEISEAEGEAAISDTALDQLSDWSWRETL
ncbi:MAG TPA: dockerin type I domain-containing protein, partial [Lacipirellula sp.]